MYNIFTASFALPTSGPTAAADVVVFVVAGDVSRARAFNILFLFGLWRFMLTRSSSWNSSFCSTIFFLELLVIINVDCLNLDGQGGLFLLLLLLPNPLVPPAFAFGVAALHLHGGVLAGEAAVGGLDACAPAALGPPAVALEDVARPVDPVEEPAAGT